MITSCSIAGRNVSISVHRSHDESSSGPVRSKSSTNVGQRTGTSPSPQPVTLEAMIWAVAGSNRSLAVERPVSVVTSCTSQEISAHTGWYRVPGSATPLGAAPQVP